MCQHCRGSSQLRAATRPTRKLPWCPLQDQKDLWHGTHRCGRWKMPAAWNLFLAPCLRASPTAYSRDRTPSPCHISRKTQEDPELRPVEICWIQNLLKNTLYFQREVMFWLKCFARRFPTNSNYNKSFQNSRVPSFLSFPANLLHSVSFKLQLGHSITNTLPLLDPLFEIFSAVSYFSVTGMKQNLSSVPTLFGLLLTKSLPVLSDLLTLAFTISPRPLHWQLREWFTFWVMWNGSYFTLHHMQPKRGTWAPLPAL